MRILYITGSNCRLIIILQIAKEDEWSAGIKYPSTTRLSSLRMASISLSRSTLVFSGLNNPSTHNASNERKLFTDVFPKPSRRKLDLIASKASTTDLSPARRRNNHHPNLWEDDFIQSLAKAYDAPSYAERAETLIREVKEIFNGMSSNNVSVHERLSMVDNVERLGIDRHFQKEIKEALDYVYRYWNDKGIGNGEGSACADLNSTALGLRILRLHRYDVSSGGIWVII